MKIKVSTPQAQQALRASIVQNTESAQSAPDETANKLPTDSFTPSGGAITTKEKFQIGTIAAAGGLLGGIPGVGAVSSFAATANNDGTDELGTMIGIAGVVTNLVATAAVVNGSFGMWPLAVPAILGAISWGGYAANRAGVQ